MGYERETDGIRVRVQPRFSLADSSPRDREYVFSYDVELLNMGMEDARLLFRHWRIHDAVGEDAEVDGEGVIGKQPTLISGASHEYSSYCVLKSPIGWMEGHYTFERPDGRQFRVAIPRFDLAAPMPPLPLPAAEDEGDDTPVMN